MRIQVIRQMGYEGTQIYVMQFGNVFQYLFSWNNEIFKQHVPVKPMLLGRIAHLVQTIRRRPSMPYTLEQIETMERIMLTGAMDSIDALKKMKTKRATIAKSDRKCMWQVRTAEDGSPLFKCLYHNQEVPFVTGKVPSHTMEVKK